MATFQQPPYELLSTLQPNRPSNYFFVVGLGAYSAEPVQTAQVLLLEAWEIHGDNGKYAQHSRREPCASGKACNDAPKEILVYSAIG